MNLLKQALFAATCCSAELLGTTVGQQSPGDLPVKLVFSAPKLDSPISVPSTVMNGPPLCGPDGRAFFQFLTPPPYYNNKVIYSVNLDGEAVSYPLSQLTNLTQVYVLFVDPGLRNAALLLQAKTADSKQPAYFMALFRYDGKLDSYAQLDLGFQPIELVELSNDRLLVTGEDASSGQPKAVLIDETGTIRRRLDANTFLPPSSEVSSILSSPAQGIDPKKMPAAVQTSLVVSSLKPVHAPDGVLFLQPGSSGKLIEFLRSGEVSTVKLHLPPGQVAHSLLADKKKLFLRTSRQGIDNEWSLYRVDSATGETTGRIETPEVPSASISCVVDSDFYAFKWIDKKAYLTHAHLQDGGL